MKRRSKEKSTSNNGKPSGPLKLKGSSVNAGANIPVSSASVASPIKPLQKSGYSMQAGPLGIKTAKHTTTHLQGQIQAAAVSTATASSQKPRPENKPFQSQQVNKPSMKSRAVETAIKKQDAKKDACTPSPEPVRSSGGVASRGFVPWKSRSDLPCKR